MLGIRSRVPRFYSGNEKAIVTPVNIAVKLMFSLIWNGLVPFLFEFIVAPVVIPVIALVVVALLEFLIPFIAVIAISAAVSFAVLVRAERLDVRGIGKF